jgi:calcineurin-like phosphoesterase family protein
MSKLSPFSLSASIIVWLDLSVTNSTSQPPGQLGKRLIFIIGNRDKNHPLKSLIFKYSMDILQYLYGMGIKLHLLQLPRSH